MLSTPIVYIVHVQNEILLVVGLEICEKVNMYQREKVNS